MYKKLSSYQVQHVCKLVVFTNDHVISHMITHNTTEALAVKLLSLPVMSFSVSGVSWVMMTCFPCVLHL